MFELTEDAAKELALFFEDKEKSSIRVYLAPGGCSGPHLAMALDNPAESDDVLEEKGFTFCIQKELYKEVQSLKVDLSYMGFTITPGVPFASSASSCGTGGGCGGCGGGCGTTN